METILVPLDFSDATTKVVRTAAIIANSLQAKLVLLHVVEPLAEYVPLAASMDVLTTPAATMQASLDPHPMAQRLERFAASLRQGNTLEVSCEVRVGLAVDEILRQAQLHNSGMIVLGSHGHGALYHLFTGSVVTGILKKTAHPVLIVPVREVKTGKDDVTKI